MGKLVEKAIEFAVIKHAGQMRKGTSIPYIMHPISVGFILKDARQSDEVVAAGILHDTLEDTDTTEDELLNVFGNTILQLVKEASEPDKGLSWELRKQHTINGMSEKTVDNLYVIVADKLHNLSTIAQSVEGEDVWLRFNRPKKDQSWYHRSIVKAVKNRRKEVRIIKDYELLVNQLFVGVDKVTNKIVDVMLSNPYYCGEKEREVFEQYQILNFMEEVYKEANQIYQEQNFDKIEPLMRTLEKRGVQFEYNSDGPFIILSFLYTLKYRLAWSDDETVSHFKRV
ncbi:HD domain-containing protein [Psychrobacillus antarcticus]|uniref:HD domain-containing protein n=1 Tax=Psychrobacillus antarcticus TaxID=2879115 RepID=UPI0024081DA9|nr:HD domain-containing protein [Psychrobacillus antarcticus]